MDTARCSLYEGVKISSTFTSCQHGDAYKVHTCGNIYNPIIIQACISFIWAIRHNEYFTFGTLRLFLKLILSIRLFHCGVDTFTLGEEIQSQSYDIYQINEVIMLTQHYLFFS